MTAEVTNIHGDDGVRAAAVAAATRHPAIPAWRWLLLLRVVARAGEQLGYTADEAARAFMLFEQMAANGDLRETPK